jgi:hypothetical protein
MFTSQHYRKLAEIIGASLADAELKDEASGIPGSTAFYGMVYDSAYMRIVEMLEADNPQFDVVRFSHACAVAIGNTRRICKQPKVCGAKGICVCETTRVDEAGNFSPLKGDSND